MRSVRRGDEREAGACFRRLLGSLPRGARSAGDETRHFRAELEGHGEVPVAAGLPRTVERVGGGFRSGRKIGARRTGLGVAHGAVSSLLPGSRALCTGAAVSRFEL